MEFKILEHKKFTQKEMIRNFDNINLVQWQISFKPAQAPLGYQPKSQKGRTVLIESLLDNCASLKEHERFSSQCFSLNLETLKARNAACPKK